MPSVPPSDLRRHCTRQPCPRFARVLLAGGIFRGLAMILPKPVQWLVRTIAVLVGLVLLLLGGLCLLLCIQMPVQAANGAAAGVIDVLAYLVLLALVAGVTLLGALLIWLGLKRYVRRVPL